MGMFDTFILKEPLKCKCGGDLDQNPQTKDMVCEMMEIHEGETTAKGFSSNNINLSQFHGDDIEIDEECDKCGGFTRFNVIFNEKGNFEIVPKEHQDKDHNWYIWENNQWELKTY